jgi:hypothetical protein
MQERYNYYDNLVSHKVHLLIGEVWTNLHLWQVATLSRLRKAIYTWMSKDQSISLHTPFKKYTYVRKIRSDNFQVFFLWRKMKTPYMRWDKACLRWEDLSWWSDGKSTKNGRKFFAKSERGFARWGGGGAGVHCGARVWFGADVFTELTESWKRKGSASSTP